jgi:hypothetical protein
MNDFDIFEKLEEDVRSLLEDCLLNFEERIINCTSQDEEGIHVMYNELDCQLPLVTMIENSVDDFMKEFSLLLTLIKEDDVKCGG